MTQTIPTDAELEILNVLWDQGPSSVRDVFDVVAVRREIGYTTVLKLLQIMHEKGLVSRDESRRSHQYRARVKRGVMQRRLVHRLLARAFGGSTEQLVVQALAAKPASKRELDEIRRLLDEMEGCGP